ncbi:ABC transporter substrate-binding protein [Chloroflexota bacterium]
MKKKIVWVVVSGLMALSLVMASCAPAVVEEEEEVIVEEEVEEEEVIVEEEVVAPGVEVPKYGGVLTVGQERDITRWDEVVGSPSQAFTQHVTNEDLWGGDWARGPAGGYGTNESDWSGHIYAGNLKDGRIAESWELPTKIEGEKGAIIFHIRQGVHWALNPDSEASRLVGGREVTADDVIFSLKQIITDRRAHIYRGNPELRVAEITSPEPWTVKVEVPWESFATAIERFGECVKMVPPEVVEEYGDMSDWKNSVGTGPFMLTDVVPGSSMMMVRNPNYWMKDPIGPGKGNQLPYMDGVKYLIIPDVSTLHAALRTGKVDWLGRGGAEYGAKIALNDTITLKRTAPQLMSKTIALTSVGTTIALKINKEPLNDIRVRRALMMAIDFEAIKRDFLGGEAQIVVFPIPYMKDYADAYYGPDPDTGEWPADCPESTKELYTYNPEKAKALLAEAGYPDGFKTNLILGPTAEEINYFSIYKDMWSKVGVDLELLPKERGALTAMRNAKSFDQMYTGHRPKVSHTFMMLTIYGTGVNNQSEIDDPVVNEAYPKIQAAKIIDLDEASRLHREVMKHGLGQVWAIPTVAPYFYDMWWPWLKNYSGEIHLGYHSVFFNWVWLDEEMKESMGY